MSHPSRTFNCFVTLNMYTSTCIVLVSNPIIAAVFRWFKYLHDYRRVVSCTNRLCEMVEWTWCWCALGWDLAAQSARIRWLWRIFRKYVNFQFIVQDFPSTVSTSLPSLCTLRVNRLPWQILGVSGSNRRGYTRLGFLDMEGWECRWLELPGWFRGWVDSARPDSKTVPEHVFGERVNDGTIWNSFPRSRILICTVIYRFYLLYFVRRLTSSAHHKHSYRW